MIRLRPRLLALWSPLLLAAGLFVAHPALAQAPVDPGINAVNQEVGLSTQDPRVIAARIINISLSLLAIIMLALVLYAGFLWMTAGGDEKKVGTAQAYLRNAIIGLIIILSSWALATFIISRLLDATGGGGGAGGGGGPGPGGGGFGGGGAASFQVRSITPSGSVPIRNVEARLLFTREVATNNVTSSIQVLRASDNAQVAGVLSVSGDRVTFVPDAACPPPNEARRCFEGDTEFIIRALTSLRSTTGQSLVCGGFAPSCEMRFTTGNLVDTSPPSVDLLSPFEGQSIPADDFVSVQARASDDSGISVVDFLADAAPIGSDGPGGSTTLRVFDASLLWDTDGLALGPHTLQAQANDIDSNRGSSRTVTVQVRPNHCFNATRDGDETGADCGGSCGACAGGACTTGGQCASGICAGGQCVEQPLISGITPTDGRPSTMVTITGVNFGTTVGRVTIGGVEARAPLACTAEGVPTWTARQIIVAVPDGAVSGPIEVTNVTSGLSDRTNDGQGPRLDDFLVNDVARPGLCAVRPDRGVSGDRLEFIGVSLGTSSDRMFWNDREISAFLSWGETRITMTAPVYSAGRYAVRSRVGGAFSNAVAFTLEEPTVTQAPVLDSLDPATGPVGEYLTLNGRFFGTRVGTVRFRNTVTGEEATADVGFPAACSSGFWRDTSIVVKVPRTIGGLGGGLPPGAYQVRVVRADRAESNQRSFQVVGGSPKPGLCAIQPSAGPVDTSVALLGERFGASAGSVSFAGSGTARVEATVEPGGWSDSRISSVVPRGAQTGFVTVTQGGRTSNGVPFAVRNCQEDPAICGGGETCCASGICSVGGSCPVTSQTAHFAWRTSTGQIPIHPEVVEECEATRPPSPSPWDRRTGGDRVCTNAEVIVRFNTQLEASSVNAGSFIVRRCTGTGADPCTEATTISARLLEVLPVDDDADYIRFRPELPASTWAPDATYQVVLTTAITSVSGLGMDARSACGSGNAYCFRFRTRSDAGACRVGSVTVTPATYTADDLRVEIPYRSNPRAADDVCLQLDGSTMDWTWDTAGDGRASITNNRGPGGNVLDRQTGTTLAETGDLPVPVNASVREDGRDVRGSGRLYVRLVPPRVEASGPNCDEACVNAALWVRFNVAMDPVRAQDPSNILLYRCTNENCRSFDPPSPLDLSTAPAPVLSTAPGRPDDDALRYLVISPTHVVGGVQQTYLEVGRFYKVVLRGGSDGFRSNAGLPLTELNDPDGYAWTFRVREGEGARCSIERVQVLPAEKTETLIGARQMFSAVPTSAPDSCSADGQPLIADQSYGWTTSDAEVADFVNGSGLGTVDTSPTPAWCTAQCLRRGSDGVAGRVANCGNDVIETTDGRYCRGAAGACAPAEDGCRTIHGDACRVLPAGSKGGEECDLGSRNGPGSSCSASCLWNPMPRVTDTPPGTCGDGIVNRGEQCDPGRSCVTGPLVGRACGSDAECGAGGACGVREQFGCSERCQALGASAAGSTCGNNDLGDGETCDDGNRSSGDGCSADCRHEGARPVVALCGNVTLEPGESCERTAGGAWPVASCDPLRCVKTGSAACAPGAANCCGDGTVDAAEDCDDGNAVGQDGCSTRCLLEGSSVGYATPSFCGDGVTGTGEQCEAAAVGDGLTDARQLAEIIGNAEPGADGRMESTLTAEVESVSGQANYALQCGFTQESSCTVPNTGLTNGGCCAVRPTLTSHYPPSVTEPGGSDVCRNVQISGTFNIPMESGSFTGNFIVAEEVAVGAACPDGTQRLGDVPYIVQNGWRGLVARAWHSVTRWFSGSPADAAPWCAGAVRGAVVVEPSGTGSKISLDLENALKPSTRYRVIFRGDPDLTDAIRQGIRSARGVVAPADPVDVDGGALSWTFRTGTAICAVNGVKVADTHETQPGLFTERDEQHTYAATVQALQDGQVVPLSSVAEYDWTWEPWSSSDVRILTIGAAAGAGTASSAPVQSQNENGHALIYAGIRITNDVVNVPTTTNRVVVGSALGTVLLCERPWPSAATAPFRDAASSPSLAGTPFETGPFFNFSTLYCLDAGPDGPTGDLPVMNITAVPTPAADASRGILRQYFFTYAEPELARDGIGVRIAANPLHLSPRAWYASRGFLGDPKPITVDGYEAIRDGATVYVAAANAETASGPVYSNIYVLSRNPDATAVTQDIYEQLVKNMAFNINFQSESQNACVDNATGGLHVVDGAVKACTADWECLAVASNVRCASLKTKLQRDTKRIADFQAMSSSFESARTRDGEYPGLQAGSYLQTLSTSRWPSWGQSLGSEVGTSLPQDPINRYLTCGRCQRTNAICTDSGDCPAGEQCVAQDGHDPATCWNSTNRTYMCPQLDVTQPSTVSRVYQYRSVNGGTRYELATELEGPGPDRWSPPLMTEVRRCDNTEALCLADADCDVVSDTGAITSTGVCRGTGGSWLYEGICRNRRYGEDAVCGNGVRGMAEACELGETLPVSCTTADGRPGTKEQTCNDCRGFIDGPATRCIANALCGNGRVDRRQCLGGYGYRYGASCSADADCADPRDPRPGDPTYAPLRCQSVGVGEEEVCDEGALNGTYGHCNRTCSGYDAFCGDGERSSGETCDNGTSNGAYCGVGCVVSDSCSLDCRTRAPHCGDARVQTPEQCDGNVEKTDRFLGGSCIGGLRAGQTCSSSAECAGGSCLILPGARSCVGVQVSRCSNNREQGCSSDANCDVRDAAGTVISRGSCIAYPTQHVRTCATPGSASQCRWNAWSDCEPVAFCGDGTKDDGEQCDDGNTSDNDSCTSLCKTNICGDSFLRTGVEECDQGTRNGDSCSATADYASTCAACSDTCRMVTQSGGYCGNNLKEGPEQCDGTALPTPLPSCRALGYDYSAFFRCTRIRASTGGIISLPGGEVVPSAQVNSVCVDDPADPNDIVEIPVTCSASCGLTGCKRCQDDPGDGSITAQVFDAFYGNQPTPNARVTLYNRGIRVSETFTDPDGVFTFTGINQRSECGFYRIIVDMPRDNACTGPAGATRPSCDGVPWPADYPNVDESLNGGYWAFESEQFTVATFASQGLRDRPAAGELPHIFLIPRVSTNETMAVFTWSGVLPLLSGFGSTHRYLDAHLVTPASMYFQRNASNEYVRCVPGTTADAGGGASGTALGDSVLALLGVMPAHAQFGGLLPGVATFLLNPCTRDISYHQAGDSDIDQFPHARLSCFHNDADTAESEGEGCGSFTVAPQAIRFKRGPHAVTGDYVFYVNDWVPQSPLNSAHFYTSVNATVRIVTVDRIYTVRAPGAGTHSVDAACNATGDGPTDGPNALGKYWKIFKQNAASGAMTVYGGGSGAFMCTGSRTTWPDPVVNPASPTGDDATVLPGPIMP